MRVEAACYHSESRGKPSANAGVKNSQINKKNINDNNKNANNNNSDKIMILSEY